MGCIEEECGFLMVRVLSWNYKHDSWNGNQLYGSVITVTSEGALNLRHSLLPRQYLWYVNSCEMTIHPIVDIQ